MAVEVRVLGSIAAFVDGREVALRPRLRRLLAALAAHRGDTMSNEDLAGALWDYGRPSHALPTFLTYLSRLRHALGDEDKQIIRSCRPGYVLAADGSSLDAARFEAALARSRASSSVAAASDAIADLDAAVARWAGPAFAEFAHSSFAGAEAARLEDLRTSAVDLLATRRIETGDYAEAIEMVRRQLTRDRLREPLWELLLRGLLAAGRRIEAARAYEELRELLRDELGVDPAPTTTALFAPARLTPGGSRR